MGKKKAILWALIFLILVAAPMPIYLLTSRFLDTDDHENRNAAEMPVFAWGDYEDYPEKFEAFFNDQIPFRNQLIRFNNSINYYVFREPSNDNVVLGGDGWLFYCIAGENPVAQSLGQWMFSDEELAQIADNLIAAERALRQRGVDFVLFIGPNKESVYSEYIPERYERISDYTATDQLVDYLREHTDITVVFPKEELLEARSEHPDLLFYYKLDTHWNQVGGYIGARALAGALGVELPELSALTLEPEEISEGDLTEMLNITVRDGDVSYAVSGVSELETQWENWDFFTEFRGYTPGGDERKLVMRRDSYGTAMAPYLACGFENVDLIFSTSFESEDIFEENADVFVYELVERKVRELLEFRIED